MIHSRCLTALMIGQQGVEVESMPANQHTVGSVTETRRAAGRHAAGVRPVRPRRRRTTARSLSACWLPVVDGSAWSLRRDGSPGVKDFPIDRDRPCLRECLPFSTRRLVPAVCLLNVFPGPGTRNNQNGSIDV
jgi:hypothetical protein